MARAAEHVGAEELGRVGVELVGFVEVGFLFGGAEADGRVAGESPGAEVGVDEVRAPRGAVAGHEEACRGTGSRVEAIGRAEDGGVG